MFHEYVKLFINNSRRISNENLTYDGNNVKKLSDGFPSEYKGFEVKIGFGIGNWAKVTWIGFLAKGQSIQKGIYPVYLYYRNIDVLILAYGVSETYEPGLEWPVSDAVTIKSYFKKKEWGTPWRYKQSLVYKPYTKEDLKNITEAFDNDLDHIISSYKAIMISTSISPTDTSPSGDMESESRMPLQIIYFGSPGTGKSHGIKKLLAKNGIIEDPKEKRKNCDKLFRTTFHPDTDYSSFVGCYKPACIERTSDTLSYEQLKNIYIEKYKCDTDKIESNFNFIKDYAESIVKATTEKGESLNSFITALFGDTCPTYYTKATEAIFEERRQNNSQIVYEFVPQIFTIAYAKAWNEWEDPEKEKKEMVFLVIEEINRGNCAQIFGDLFQLLDRKDDGRSEYRIKADKDLATHLKSVLKPNSEGIQNDELCLPPNLTILATMNTSDQSLFPMDSAFKRRWEWEYVPTKVEADKTKVVQFENKKGEVESKFDKTRLGIGMYEYNWSTFLKEINKRIKDATHSDDKQLGFWFVKTPEGQNQISVKTFVCKVIFYLWNDVFKDYGKNDKNPFSFQDKDGKWELCPFSSFFNEDDGNINLGVVHGFLKNLGINPDLEPKALAEVHKSMQTPPAAEEGQ